MAVNQQHLKQAWDTSQVSTKEDWVDWMRRLEIEFMKESPSHALRACMGLVEIHPPLAKELFNAAFVSCWSELYDQYQVWNSPTSFHSLLKSPCLSGRSGPCHRIRNYVKYSPARPSPSIA